MKKLTSKSSQEHSTKNQTTEEDLPADEEFLTGIPASSSQPIIYIDNESDNSSVFFEQDDRSLSSFRSSRSRKNSTRAFNRQQPRARCWIDATFQKRECVLYTPSPKDPHRCCCGKRWTGHPGTSGPEPEAIYNSGEIWSPSRNTIASPTDAYGIIEFQGGPHPSKAQYIRLAHDTRPDLILNLFQREWAVDLPKLLITVQGGKANFELQAKLKKVLRKGLLKAAKTTGAWIFTGGTNTGVTRQVGHALLLERSQRSGRVVSIGIAPWGIIENNHELLGRNRDVPYHSISSPRSKCAALNNKHAYFLLVDNGTTEKYGAEIILRRKLEKYISHQKLHPYTHSSTPVVCLVIEGGTNTIRAVLEYVTDNPPVPVVVCDGSGRAADLIAFMHKYAADSEDDEQTVLESMKDYLVSTIQRTFEVGVDQAECLYGELLQCTRKKNLITVFRITERSEGISQELDQTILTALFKSQHLTPSEQLSLALTWNRVDIARSEIFIYGQEWPPGALEEAMMQALEHDRIDFVKLLLENGVSMRKFLTIPRLEDLYNTKQGPSNTLGYILKDLRPQIQRGYIYTLHDIGLVINKLMGGAYRAYYTRRKFRPIYAKIMNKSPHIHRNSSSFVRYYGNALSLLAETLPAQKDLSQFEYPFNELLIWAVLTKRQQMALLMWQHGEEALAKSLVACKLYKAMAHEAAEDDLETEIYEELRNYGKEFENIALELLDFYYRQDDDQAQQLLTCELQNWSGQTCLSLAVAANHRALLAHPCSQIILADLWMGGLRTRKNTNIKVILGLLCPVYIAKLEFKSKEELQLMPQTQEEHYENDSNPDDTTDGVLGSEVLLSETIIPRDTIVQENGKVLSEVTAYENYVKPFEFYELKTNRPLTLKKKLYEFYTAPITKFWANSIAYILFLFIFSYTVLVKMEQIPSWAEYFAISYIVALGCEKIREIVSSEPVAISHKFAVWAWNMWNPCDAAAIIFFLIGLSLRLKPSTMDIGRVMYCVDSIYWYLRILNILGVNKYLGPLVTMMGKMVKNMIYFVVLLLVVLMSFGVCRQAILFPNKEPNWSLARDVFFEPYFMLYGEVFADGIDPPCGDDPGQVPCLTGRWITPAVMSTYLLVANILLINLLIAVFNNIFNEVNSVSHQVWMFQRFTVVMEYEQKPVLPPPLIILSHVFLLIKYLNRKIHGKSEVYDNGLKLFLEKDEMERLYDFEEECVEGYFAEKEFKLQQCSDERIKITTDRVENIVQKVEDINTKENNQLITMQSLEFRLRKVEEFEEQILSQLAMIHRFMTTKMSDDLPDVKLVEERTRRISEKSENTSETEVFTTVRRKPTRSLTEVRPDAYIFDDGLHFEVRTLEEQDEEDENDSLTKPPPAQHKLNVLGERQRSSDSKTSILSENSVSENSSTFSTEEVTQLPVDGGRFRAGGLSAPYRRDSTGRRSSEGGESDRGHNMPRRQLSLTHSEPDGGSDMAPSCSQRTITEPRITVCPPSTSASQSNARAMLLAMHTEYTSITDELESVCGLLSPPRTPRLLSPPRPGQLLKPLKKFDTKVTSQIPPRRRHVSEMSNPEMALYLEKEHLRNAEEDDYQLMENLIKRQHEEDSYEWTDTGQAYLLPSILRVVDETREFRSGPRSLRRASAVDGDMPVFTVSVDSTLTVPDAQACAATASRQDSGESAQTDSSHDETALLRQIPSRPSIVVDSSLLPTLQRELPKADSKASLHMQSETMC